MGDIVSTRASPTRRRRVSNRSYLQRFSMQRSTCIIRIGEKMIREERNFSKQFFILACTTNAICHNEMWMIPRSVTFLWASDELLRLNEVSSSFKCRNSIYNKLLNLLQPTLWLGPAVTSHGVPSRHYLAIKLFSVGASQRWPSSLLLS